jgi:hypothetical protein
MITNLIYILATSSLLVGSILSFSKEEVSDYFYLSGTALFFIKSTLCLIKDLKKNKKSILLDSDNVRYSAINNDYS